MTEYRAQVLADQHSREYVAPFPEEVGKAVQYGCGTKVHAVYLSQYQLIPYQRVREHFAHQMNIPIFERTVYNFNKQAYELLTDFEKRVQAELMSAKLAHADETGINIGGKRHWLHCMTNDY